MVIEKNIPHARWDNAMAKPPRNHQMTFIIPARHPEGQPLSTICDPNGHRAKAANLNVCNPNGIPMMVIIINRLEIKYSKAIIKPPNSTQMIFKNIFILIGFISICKCTYNL